MSEVLTTYVQPRPARRRPGAVVAVGVAIAAVLVAGAFAIVSIAASEGSDSPEAAVEKLLDAVEAADPVGILESLVPGERASLRPGLDDLVAELEGLGVVERGFELGPVGGIDVRIEGLELSSEALGEGVGAVTIEGGTVTAGAEPSALPLGPLLRAYLGDAVDSTPAAGATEDLAGMDLPVIITLEEGGGWYVSIWYSVAEAARRSAGEPVPDFGHGVAPVGAESPEAALSGAVDAALRLDAAGVIARLDPAEARALQDYAPLFLDDVAVAVAEEKAGGDLDLQVDRLDTTVVRDGSTARVTVDGFAVSGHLPELGAVSLSFDGECYVIETDSAGREETCLDDLEASGPGFATGGEALSVTAVERDGSWYLSPTRTVLDSMVASVRELDLSDLEGAENGLGGLLGLGLFGIGGLGSGMDDSGMDGITESEGGIYAACSALLDDLAPRATDKEAALAAEAMANCVAGLGQGAGQDDRQEHPTTTAPGN